MILAIDFDGTLHYGEWPEIGAPAPDSVEMMQRLKSDGHILVINSCREGPYKTDMEDWLSENEIPFDRINEHAGETDTYGYESRKIYADVYIDDRNLGGLPPWKEIYDIVSGKVKMYRIYKMQRQ